MRSNPRSFAMTIATTGLLASLLQAQSGPAQYTAAAADPYLTNTVLAAITAPAPIWSGTTGSFEQVNITKSGLGGLSAGQFVMTMTTTFLNPHYHQQAAGMTGVLLGKFDLSGNAPVFTPTTVAKNMNPATGSVFGLMIEPRDGLYATVDWSTGPMISYRPNVTSGGNDVPFPTPIPIGGVALGPFVDPAACYVDGQLVLFYVGGSGIEMRPLTPTIVAGSLTAVTAGAATVVASVAGATAHSPTPIIDMPGNCQGLFMAGVIGSDSDMYYHASLNAIDAPIKMYDDASWQNNGGVAGGSFYFRANANSNSIWRIDGAYMIGSRAPIGGTATITIFADRGMGTIVTSSVAASTQVGPPVTIPGWAGQYGLGPVVILFTNTVSLDADERGSASLPVPNNPALKGIRLPIQALSAPTGSLPPALTNTSWIEVY